MNIVINKDIETDYRNELIRGFSTKELISAVVAIGSGVGIGIALNAFFNVSIKSGIYVGMIPGFLIVFIGFRRFQGLSAWAYIKEILWEWKTKTLAYDTEIERRPGEFAPKAHPGIKKQRLKGGERNGRKRKNDSATLPEGA